MLFVTSKQNSDLYHPLETVQAAHLGGSVHGGHPVLRLGQQVAPGLPDEVLQDVQVTLLGSQVYRGHIGARHGSIGTETQLVISFLSGGKVKK